MSEPEKMLYHVSFDFEDDDPEAGSGDFRDLLMEKFEQAVLENRMTNVVVQLDHRRMLAEESEETVPILAYEVPTLEMAGKEGEEE